MQLERMHVRLDADLDRAARLVRVDVVQRQVRQRALLDDAIDDAVGRRVVAALEARLRSSSTTFGWRAANFAAHTFIAELAE